MDKDRPTFSEMFRNSTSFQQILVSIKQELRTKIPGTPVGTMRNSISVEGMALYGPAVVH